MTTRHSYLICPIKIAELFGTLLFRILKSGLRVEERKFNHADDLRKCLAFDAANVCRVFAIARRRHRHRGRPWNPSENLAHQRCPPEGPAAVSSDNPARLISEGCRKPYYWYGKKWAGNDIAECVNS